MHPNAPNQWGTQTLLPYLAMSHFAKIQSKFVNQAALIAALTAMGLKPQVVQNQRLYNSYGEGESRKLKQGIFVHRNNVQCGCTCDIGFEKQDDEFEVIYDQWSLRHWRWNNDRNPNQLPFMQQLHEEYAVACAKQVYGDRVSVTRHTLDDGRVQIQLELEDDQTEQDLLMIRR